MNKDSVYRIAAHGLHVSQLVHKHGAQALVATYDWQSPLRSGGAKGPKGEHSDPTAATVITPDPLALEHGALTRELRAFHQAALNLQARLNRLTPLTEAQIHRGRTTTDTGCVACGGPAPAGHRRSGMCDACRKAWERAGRPTLATFQRQRTRDAQAAAQRLHEHEQDTA